MLRHERILKGSLVLVFVTDSSIKKLNQEFLKRRHATDVLAFDYHPFSDRSKRKKILMGEIVISTEMARRQAKIYRTSIQQEIILYIIHGILHLLGFDDHTPEDIRRMRRKEEELLRLVG